MVHRAATLAVIISILLFAGCGDSSTGPDPEPKPGKGIISGTVTTTDDQNGIEDALLELIAKNAVAQAIYSDAEGKFSFKSVGAGQYKVKLTLPRGYRKKGSTSETIQVDNNVTVEFKGEPIREDAKTVKAGEQDTVATASGAFVAVDASRASSDIEVTLEEVEDESTESGSKSVKIQIGPPGSSQSAVNMVQSLSKTSSNPAESIELNIAQRVKKSSSDVLEFVVETSFGPLSLYADAKKEEITDTATNVAKKFLIHPITFPTNTAIEFFSKPIEIDNSCDNDYRKLKEYSSDDIGSIPIILIHGIQLSKSRCKEFDDFEPLNLDDGDRDDTFDYLVEKLTSNLDIDFDYKFYTYKYPSNTSIQEASNGLWELMRKKNIKNPVVLAHSMGGLVARKMLVDEGEDKVKALITLGTPHRGTPLVKKLLNPIEFLKNCPSEKAPLGCAAADIAELLQARKIPNTSGLRALKEDSPIVDILKKKQGSSDKVFTLGGSLSAYSAITDIGNLQGDVSYIKYQATYELGYFLMKIIGGEDTDGMVPLNSALPDWSTKVATLEDHDHTEMVRGENYDEISTESVYNEIKSLLVRFSGGSYFGEPPTIASANSNPNPSTPNETVNFTAELSGDEPIDCTWDFGNGTTSSKCNATHTYQNTGTFNVSFEATNEAGSADTTFIHTVEQSGKAGVIYVDADATGSNNGTSWTNAFKYLQDGLAAAKAGQEIWVAEGTYYPDESDKYESFELKSDIKLLGGFSGDETSKTERKTRNSATLSGNIGVDGKGDNTEHIIKAKDINNSLIDRFTITGSNDERSNYANTGGAFVISGSDIKITRTVFIDNRTVNAAGAISISNNSDVLIEGALFQDNWSNYGAGIYLKNSSLAILRSNFNKNKATRKGAGIYSENSTLSISKDSGFRNNRTVLDGAAIFIDSDNKTYINKTIFSSNISSAGSGGAIYNKGKKLKIKNTLFIADSAGGSGGALYDSGFGDETEIINTGFQENYSLNNGGAIYDEYSDMILINTGFVKNTAEEDGGAVYDDGNRIRIINSTFHKNKATGYNSQGGGIYLSESYSTITNSIFWSNFSDYGNQLYGGTDYSDTEVFISNSIIKNGIPSGENYIDSGGNIEKDPNFINPSNFNYHLQSNSPAINAGLNDALDLNGDGNITDDVPVDLDGHIRIQGGTVDIGAYESGGN